MVLASNEWLNNCEDDQRSTTTTTGNSPTGTTTTTVHTAATTTASATAPIGNRQITLTAQTTPPIATTTIQTVINSTTNTTTSTTTTIAAISTNITTARTNSANNEIMSENNTSEIHPPKQQQQQQTGQEQKNVSDVLTVDLSGSNHTQTEIVNNNSEVLNCDTSNANANANTTTIYAYSNSNNTESLSGNNSAITDILVINSNANDDQIFNTNNTSLYSNENSNASTLQSAIVRQSKGVDEHLPLSSPITPQALSSALQSVMNASNNTNTVNTVSVVNVTNATAGHIQNNLFGTLGIDIGGGGNGINSNNVSAKEAISNFGSSGLIVEVQQTNAIHNVGNNTHLSMNLEVANSNGQAKVILICEANSHPFQTRTIQLTPNIECKVGRLIAKSKASESNAIFDCKVLSRNHAVLWYTDDGKFWVKDTKSSNGTFINENKLGPEAAELHFGDIVKFGVDVLENSRKEVHGCIIAFVKLYLPDGREAISIEATAQRSQYSGEGRISYEEMHRLNLYVQEVSQREKVLKSKLFNIQNVLDATRKNSALCWQSLIAEDQLLHRINSLEKKLQIMEKNVPESLLRNEVLKLLEDKNSYQLTAKEALRKVYQERCDALQMLSKMELAYANSDGECKILRDQIMSTKQSLQDVNTRLQLLETDYNEYKEDAERKTQEIKEQEEQRIAEITEKLQQRELECDDLRRRISEFMLKRAELIDEEEKKLELQAIEKLDAVIGGMDLGEDDDDEDAHVDVDDDEGNSDDKAKSDESDGNEHKEDGNEKEAGAKELRKPKVVKSLGDVIYGRKSLNSSDEIEILKTYSETDAALRKRIKKKGNAKQSTILKWLQNSDLNEKEGSLDIFKAICNESDSSDEQDLPKADENKVAIGLDTESGIDTNSAEEIKLNYKKSINKLQSIETILCQLVEAELSTINAKECYKSNGAYATTSEHTPLDNDEALEVNKKVEDDGTISDDQKLLLLQRSVAMLNEVNHDICESLHLTKGSSSLVGVDVKEATPPTHINKNTMASKESKRSRLLPQEMVLPMNQPRQDELNYIYSQELYDNEEESLSEKSTARTTLATTAQNQNTMASKESKKSRLLPQEIVLPINKARQDELSYIYSQELYDNEEESLSEKSTARTTLATTKPTPFTIISISTENENKLKDEVCSYQEQINELNLKLEQVESDAENTLEIMQIECETYREKVAQLNKVVQKACEEKLELKRLLDEHVKASEIRQQQIKLSPPAAAEQSNLNTSVEICDKPNESNIEQPTILSATPEVNTNPNDNKTNEIVEQGSGTELFPQQPKVDSSGKLVVEREDFEAQLSDDLVAISSTVLQSEEELIVYKERLEKTQNDNLQLRNEIAALLLKSGTQAQAHMNKQMTVYGIAAAAAAMIIYFATTYF